MLDTIDINNFIGVNRDLIDVADAMAQLTGKNIEAANTSWVEIVQDVADVLTAALAVYNSAMSNYPVEKQAIDQLLHAVAKFEG